MRRNRPDIHINQERWLVSYADFITLLFAFFVVMYSISQVNESKYQALSKTLETTFSARVPAASAPDNAQSATGVNAGELPLINPPTDSKPIEFPTPATDATDDPLIEISERISERFKVLIDEQLIVVSGNDAWLKIELKDSILFASAGAEPSAQARNILTEVASILKYYDNPIQVEGHTDSLPITHPRYPSNWELSTARASAIVKYLIDAQIAPSRLAAVGFGEYQPVASNDTEAGRAQNRRVSIMVAKRAIDRP